LVCMSLFMDVLHVGSDYWGRYLGCDKKRTKTVDGQRGRRLARGTRSRDKLLSLIQKVNI